MPSTFVTGYLWKKGENGLFGSWNFLLNWRKRWFRLEGTFLYYFYNENSNCYRGFIDLSSALDCFIPGDNFGYDHKHGWAFIIRTPTRNYQLMAPTRQERKMWTSKIRGSMSVFEGIEYEACEECDLKQETLSDILHHNSLSLNQKQNTADCTLWNQVRDWSNFLVGFTGVFYSALETVKHTVSQTSSNRSIFARKWPMSCVYINEHHKDLDVQNWEDNSRLMIEQTIHTWFEKFGTEDAIPTTTVDDVVHSFYYLNCEPSHRAINDTRKPTTIRVLDEDVEMLVSDKQYEMDEIIPFLCDSVLFHDIVRAGEDTFEQQDSSRQGALNFRDTAIVDEFPTPLEGSESSQDEQYSTILSLVESN